MSKKRRDRTEDATPLASDAPIGPVAPILLLAITALASLLALFQWMELLVVRAGGTAVCGINDTVNCQRVWDTPFASGIHKGIGVPVAGLGLLWGLAAFGLALALTWRLLTRRGPEAQVGALKIMALLGVVAIVVFAAVSIQAGALCLTCLGTYAVVAAYAVVALRMLPGPLVPAGAALKPALVWTGAFVVGAYLLVLGPGIATPRSDASGASSLRDLPNASTSAPPRAASGQDAGQTTSSVTRQPMSETENAVAGFFDRLPPPERQAVSNSLAIFRASGIPSGPLPAPRRVDGPPEAAVKIIDWVEIRCGHCRFLDETLEELARVVPEGSISVESRNYPLAAECNPYVERKDPTGVSCLAAKALICLEKANDFKKVRSALFAEQQALTRDRVMEIASSGSVGRRQLEACVQSSETDQKLREDVQYAAKYNPEGTPLVVVNGRKATPSGPFLYAMALTGGDEDSAAFSRLPKPNLAADDHAGHGH